MTELRMRVECWAYRMVHWRALQKKVLHEELSQRLLSCVRDQARKLVNFFPYQSALKEMRSLCITPYALLPIDELEEQGVAAGVGIKAFRLLLGDQALSEEAWGKEISEEKIKSAAGQLVKKSLELQREFSTLCEKYPPHIALCALGEGTERAEELLRKERELNEKGYRPAVRRLAVLAENHLKAAECIEEFIERAGWQKLTEGELGTKLLEEFDYI